MIDAATVDGDQVPILVAVAHRCSVIVGPESLLILLGNQRHIACAPQLHQCIGDLLGGQCPVEVGADPRQPHVRFVLAREPAVGVAYQLRRRRRQCRAVDGSARDDLRCGLELARLLGCGVGGEDLGIDRCRERCAADLGAGRVDRCGTVGVEREQIQLGVGFAAAGYFPLAAVSATLSSSWLVNDGYSGWLCDVG